MKRMPQLSRRPGYNKNQLESTRPKMASQVALVVKSPPANAGDGRVTGSIPGWGRPPGGGHGSPFQYSYLENPRDRGAWWATAIESHRVGHDWNDLARRPKMAGDWTSGDLEPHYMLTVIHQHANWLTHGHHDSSEVNHKRPKSGWWPISWKSPPLPRNSWIKNNPPTH